MFPIPASASVNANEAATVRVLRIGERARAAQGALRGRNLALNAD
jgi:hypothetical protein